MSTALKGRPHAGSSGGQYKLDSREMGVKLAGWEGGGGEDLGGVGEGE